MPTILTKRSNTPGAVPATANLTNAAGGAELAVNTADKRLFSINSSSAIIEVGTNPSSLTCADASFTVARVGSLTISSLSLTNVTVTSATVTTLTGTSANITNISGTSLTVSTATLSGGTANGVLYLNASKVATSGSALTFDGSAFNLIGTGAVCGAATGTATGTLYVKGASSNASGLIISQNNSTDTSSITNFYNGPMVFGVNNAEQMRLTTTGLGIGTSSPSAKLTINDANGIPIRMGDISSAPASQTAVYVGASTSALSGGNGDLVLIPRTSDARSILFYTGSGTATLRATIDSSGNLGLGVTPSAWTSPDFRGLQVGSGIAVYGRGSGDADRGGMAANAYNDGAWKYIATGNATRAEQSDGQHLWFTAASGTAGNTISFTQAMTLDASSNLFVGGTTGSAKLNLQTTTNSSSDSEYIRLYNAGENVGYISWINGNGDLARITGTKTGGGASANDGILTFSTALDASLTERARITSGGYFKASDAGTYVGSTGTYHELRNTANETAALFSCSNTGFTSSVMSSTAYPVSGTGFKHLICRSDNGNDEVMNIRGDGNLYNDNGVYGSISDQRLKQDIADAPSQWNDIKAVRFRKYRMKDDVARDENAPYLLGVVAQELEQVSPGLVDDGEVKTVKSSILLMKAAVALQEAMTRIEQLEAKVAALESK